MTASEGRQKPVRQGCRNAFTTHSKPATIYSNRTEFIPAKRRLNIPAVWLKPEGLTPSVEDVVADSVSTDLGAWDEQNLGVRLVDGHIELRLDTPDDVWVACLFKAFRFLSVDAHARPMAFITSPSILIHVDKEATIDRWAHRWPKGRNIDHQGRKVRTEFRYSAAATKTAKAILPDERAAAEAR